MLTTVDRAQEMRNLRYPENLEAERQNACFRCMYHTALEDEVCKDEPLNNKNLLDRPTVAFTGTRIPGLTICRAMMKPNNGNDW